MKKRLITLAMLVLMLFTVTGCEFTRTVMSVSKENSTGFSMSYKKFSGTKSYTLRVKQPGAMVLDIESESGTLNVCVTDSDKNVIYEANNIATGSYIIELPESGNYTVKMMAEDHRGSYAADWSK